MDAARPIDENRHRVETLALALGAFALVFILWQSSGAGSVLYPFRLLVTFVHESGHGLAAILTGGHFQNFQVFDNGSGVARTSGGNSLFILPMGYLGAALFGAIILFAANRVRAVQNVALVAGVYFLVCAILFTGEWAVLIGAGVAILAWLLAPRTPNPRLLRLIAVIALGVTLFIVRSDLALLIGLGAGTILLALASFGTPSAIRFCLDALAFATGLNACDDLLYLWSNQAARVGTTPNDALAMAQYTNTPTWLWIVLWSGLAVAIMAAAVYYGLLREHQP